MFGNPEHSKFPHGFPHIQSSPKDSQTFRVSPGIPKHSDFSICMVGVGSGVGGGVGWLGWGGKYNKGVLEVTLPISSRFINFNFMEIMI